MHFFICTSSRALLIRFFHRIALSGTLGSAFSSPKRLQCIKASTQNAVQFFYLENKLLRSDMHCKTWGTGTPTLSHLSRPIHILKWKKQVRDEGLDPFSQVLPTSCISTSFLHVVNFLICSYIFVHPKRST